MRYVPSLPPSKITGVWDRMMVSGLTAVKAVKPVGPRTLPPLVTPPRHEEPLREAMERRHDTHLHGDRRTYCRRSRQLPVLVELRSGLERRHNKQRTDDPTEHIDINA